MMIFQLPPTDCYIFDPHEVQTSGYVNEINNHKSDTPDGRKSKGKHNVDIQVHKNELQNAEQQTSANRNKLNNTKDAVRNQRNAALQEGGLSNCQEKSKVNLNGVHSHSNLKSNQNTNQNKEGGAHVCSAQPPNCSAKGALQPRQHNDHSKLPSVAAESCQYEQVPGENGSVAPSAIPGTQSNGTCSPDTDFPRNAGQQAAVGSESASDNHMHSTQSTGHTVLSKGGEQAVCEAQRHDSGDQACRTETLNGCLTDRDSNNPPQRPKPETSWEAEQARWEEVDGEFEEEDADVAEALAALEAATAGEDFEEEEEEY
ncbi:PDCD10 and GCKIII kinases-associated protein 1 isoform X2 [Paroedura picta]|uniref:PDCD10 and GCKIII kinases-associated protein 1 isoform X2 n=1 Tax=Paroedura picta TaxID=143630 RepID=UPI004056AAAF